MKRTIVLLIVLCISGPSIQSAHAQIPGVSIVTGAIKKVIQAIDLQIQQQQNKTIWLQNAQKTLENTMSQLKLNDISDVTQKQFQLYSNYFQELQQVKDVLTTTNKILDMVQRQKELLTEYNQAWGLLKQDKHFSPSELQSMSAVYSGILNESMQNIEEMEMVATSFSSQMTDGKRQELMQATSKRLDKNVGDLRSFNDRNINISLSRAQSDQEVQQLKQLYGVQ